MSYELHITRKTYWTDAEGPIITPEEWLALAHSDPELAIDDPETEPYFAVWGGRDEYQCWIDYSAEEGGLYTEDPTDEFFAKMAGIADRLNAKIQGSDGETYLADGSIKPV